VGRDCCGGARHGEEWLSNSDRAEARAMPFPRSLANTAPEISEKKCVKARQWAGGRTSKTKCRMPKIQRPGSTVAGRTKRLASRFYRIKTGHCLFGQYLNWTKNRPIPQCNQTQEHLLKVCPEWKAQQKILWAEVRKETGREGPAEDPGPPSGREVRAVLAFFSATDMGRRVSAEEGVSEVSEAELREWGEEQRAEAEGPGAGVSYRCSFARRTLWHPQEMGRGRVALSFVSFFCLSRPLGCFSFVISLVRTLCRKPTWAEGKGSLQPAVTAQTADRKPTASND